MKAQFSQKMQGSRRAVMEAIAAITHTRVIYSGAPSFAYNTGDWHIDREGVLTSPVFSTEGGGPLFHADLMGTIGTQGIAAEGLLTVTIFPEDFDPAHLTNIRGMLAGKATLLRHALGVEVDPDACLAAGDVLERYGLPGGFVFPCFAAATTFAGILAPLQMAERIHAQAAAQLRVRARDMAVVNEKYAMRCFLWRIGMIGRDYAVARKELLRRLPGNSSFKSGRPSDNSPNE